MTLNWLFQYVFMKQVQSNNGVPALTLNYQEKKQRIKTYEPCHFCTQKLPNRGSMGITRAIVKNKKKSVFVPFTCLSSHNIWDKTN